MNLQEYSGGYGNRTADKVLSLRNGME